jgi:hypothetical protein
MLKLKLKLKFNVVLHSIASKTEQNGTADLGELARLADARRRWNGME